MTARNSTRWTESRPFFFQINILVFCCLKFSNNVFSLVSELFGWLSPPLSMITIFQLMHFLAFLIIWHLETKYWYYSFNYSQLYLFRVFFSITTFRPMGSPGFLVWTVVRRYCSIISQILFTQVLLSYQGSWGIIQLPLFECDSGASLKQIHVSTLTCRCI